jgi:hypothetical protein
MTITCIHWNEDDNIYTLLSDFKDDTVGQKYVVILYVALVSITFALRNSNWSDFVLKCQKFPS